MSLQTPADYHAHELVKHCRVCGKRFARGSRQQHKSKTPKTLIAACHGTDIDQDDERVHPPEVCHACLSQMRRIKAAQGSAVFRTTANIFTWTPHTEENCCVCEHFETTLRGGRPKKQKSVGRQSGEPPSRTLEALSEVAGVSLASGVSPSRLTSSHVLEANVVCIICQAVVDTPVQLNCDHLVCHPCIQQRLIDDGPICPGCRETMDSTHFSKCTTLVQVVIRHLRIHCKYQCKYPVYLEDLLKHEEACSQLTHQQLPRGTLTDATLEEMMEVPLTEPLSADEEALCSRLVRRSTQDGKLVITTGGQVRCKGER